MGLALGILGILTFASMFGMGYCLTKKSHIKDELEATKKELDKLKKSQRMK